MKQLSTLCVLAIAMLTFVAHGADSYEQIDLAGSDDSAVDRANGPTVERTEDGYIDVVCDDATVASVLQQFRRCTKMNILSGESTNLNRRVSASLNHVPWCTALQSILGLANFKMDSRDGIWYVSEKTAEEVKCSTRYFVLKHASAVDLADLFNGVAMKTSYEERNSIRSLSAGLLKGSAAGKSANDEANDAADAKSAIAGRAKATAYPNINMLVLTGPEKNLYECERIIRELDRPVTQVYIEARFIELSTEALHKLGVQWDQLSSWGATAKGLKAGYQSSDGKAANYGEVTTQRSLNTSKNKTLSTTESDTLSSSMSSSGDDSANMSNNGNINDSDTSSDSTSSSLASLVPSAIAEAAGAGATAADMGWKNASTFSGQLSADDFRLALSAFEQLQEGKLFSNPRIIVANGKEARVDITTKYPYVEMTTSRSGSDSQNLDVSTKLETIPGTDKNLFAGEAFFSYGIALSVKPRVSPAGLISVEVVPSISNVKRFIGANRDDSGNFISDEPATAYPVIDVKTINTEFTMKDGATAVIGGLSQTTEEDIDSGIPYLRKIPWIGPKLFGWQSRQKIQNEILVCVTVGIANPETLQKDAGLPTNAVLGREYVEGRRLEPGLRPEAVKNITTVDKRTLDDIRRDPYRSELAYREDDKDVDLESEAPEKEPVAAVEKTKPAKAVEEKPVEKKPAEKKPVEKKPVEPKPVVVAPVETKPAETKPAEPKPVEAKPVVVAPVVAEESSFAETPAPAEESAVVIAPAAIPAASAEESSASASDAEGAPAQKRRRRRH